MALKVIGAGLGRTGTASIKLALEELGIGRCYHMGEVMQDLTHIDHWINAADGCPQWEQFLDDYGAAVDYPACTFWHELAEYYPGAKVLLSVRSAESWFESTNETIMSPRLYEFLSGSPFGDMSKRVIWDTLDHRMGDSDYMVSYFNRRNDEIREAIPADRLLVYEAKQGWEPLCEFLELPVPDKPFPRVNTRDETRQLIDYMIAQSGDTPDVTAISEAADALFENKPGQGPARQKVFLLQKHHSGPLFRSFSLRRSTMRLERSKNCPRCGTFSLRIFPPRRPLDASCIGSKSFFRTLH